MCRYYQRKMDPSSSSSSSSCMRLYYNTLFLPFFLLLPHLLASPLPFPSSPPPPPPPPPSLDLTSSFPPTPFRHSFSPIWPPLRHLVSPDPSSVRIFLDRDSGAGFRSKLTYVYGFFSAAIKLPANKYTAGVITTLYTSNGELFPYRHDELDFEFLGRIPGEEYILQTNVYGNGSTNTGREQRFRLWFDPTADFHNYSILWTPHHAVFFVDNVPIREFPNIAKLAGQYPSKPMYVYATIWDGSDWATDGGKYKANYSYAPFVASYTNLILSGCAMHCSHQLHVAAARSPSKPFRFSHRIPPILTKKQRHSMNWVKINYMFYDYCRDTKRYPTPLPECLSESRRHRAQEQQARGA